MLARVRLLERVSLAPYYKTIIEVCNAFAKRWVHSYSGWDTPLKLYV